MSKETGGPAFPTENQHQSANHLWHYEGMTLRDYFAAKAMQGMLAENGGGAVGNDKLAEFAYHLADAMIKAREQ